MRLTVIISEEDEGRRDFVFMCSAYGKSTPLFPKFHLLLLYSLELNYIKSDFSHLYLHIVTHNLQVKNKFYKFQKIN